MQKRSDAKGGLNYRGKKTHTIHIQSKELFSSQKEITHPFQYNQMKPHYSQQHCLSSRHVYEEQNQPILDALLCRIRSSTHISHFVKCSRNSAKIFRLHLIYSTACVEPEKQSNAGSSTVHLHCKASIISHTITGHMQLSGASLMQANERECLSAISVDSGCVLILFGYFILA